MSRADLIKLPSRWPVVTRTAGLLAFRRAMRAYCRTCNQSFSERRAPPWKTAASPRQGPRPAGAPARGLWHECHQPVGQDRQEHCHPLPPPGRPPRPNAPPELVAFSSADPFGPVAENGRCVTKKEGRPSRGDPPRRGRHGTTPRSIRAPGCCWRSCRASVPWRTVSGSLGRSSGRPPTGLTCC